MGRDPLDAAIGGDALLKAALHQLGVTALLLHLVRVRVRVRLESGLGLGSTLTCARGRARRRQRLYGATHCGVGWVRAASSAATSCDARLQGAVRGQ